MRKRSIPGSTWTTRSGSRHSQHAARQRLGQAEPAFGPAQQDQPAVGRDQPALEIGGHFLASDGWQIERQKDIFGHGGVALSLLAKELALITNF